MANNLTSTTFTSNLNGYQKRYNTIAKIEVRLAWVRKKIQSLPSQRSAEFLRTKKEYDNFYAADMYNDERDFLKLLRSGLRAEQRKKKKRLLNKQAYEVRREDFNAFKQRQAEARQKKDKQSQNPK